MKLKCQENAASDISQSLSVWRSKVKQKILKQLLLWGRMHHIMHPQWFRHVSVGFCCQEICSMPISRWKVKKAELLGFIFGNMKIVIALVFLSADEKTVLSGQDYMAVFISILGNKARYFPVQGTNMHW